MPLRSFKYLLVTGSLLVSGVANGISLQELIESIKTHHPKLLETAAKRNQAEFEEMAASGEFDPIIDQRSNFRVSGYYSGQYLEQKLTKRFEDMGGKTFGTYRISDGSFPGYEGAMRTLAAGEANVGVGLSLLQNRDTDKYRTALQNSLLEKSNWQARERAAINDVVYKGIQAYLNWYQAVLRYQVIDELVVTTETRFRGIKERVEIGDLAAITLTEFSVTLMSRNMALQNAELDLQQAKQALVFYWRDQYGQMRPVSDVPDSIDGVKWPFTHPDEAPDKLQQTIDKHPLVQSLKAQRAQAVNNERLKANDMLPTLDVELKVARDVGGGSVTLQGTETKLGLQFSMPLGLRTAKARHAQARLKVKEVDYALRDLTDELNRDITQALQAIKYAKTLFNMNEDAVVLTEKLLAQELIRFRAGASDLFLLNSREQRAIQAKLELIGAKINLHRRELRYLAGLGTLGDV